MVAMSRPYVFILGALIGVVIFIFNAALAVNFHDCAGRRARSAVESMNSFRSDRSWEQGLSPSMEDESRIARQFWITRIMGAVFSVVGVLLIVVSVLGVIRATSGR